MRYTRLALMLVGLLGGAAHAEPVLPLSMIERERPAEPKVNFRLVEDPAATSTPVHTSGMIAQTRISPNATLGLGLLKAAPKNFGEARPDAGAPRSRKAAVRFTLRF